MDRYPSNTALYADPALVETVDYARRWRRHELSAGGEPGPHPAIRTAVIAPHGGNIEPGTSELCLAVAGYHPATGAPTGGGTHDYWMFEAIRPADNAELHVTSVNCNDGFAESICGAARNAVALHGFATGVAEADQVVLVGGASEQLRAQLATDLAAAGFDAREPTAGLEGTDERNIVNRTVLRAGAQLELSRGLRRAMFGDFTREHRKDTTTDLFWAFVTATRSAVARHEATQPIP